MSIVFKILHIPSGNFITAFRSSGNTSEALFYDSNSALSFLHSVNGHAKYISGGPVTDFCLGTCPVSEYRPIPILSEFELLPFDLDSLSETEQNRILHIRYDDYAKRNVTDLLH